MQSNLQRQKADQQLSDGGKTVEKEEMKWSKKELLGVMDIFIILIMVMISWVFGYAKAYQIAHFNQEQFIVCQLYFNKAVFKDIWATGRLAGSPSSPTLVREIT